METITLNKHDAIVLSSNEERDAQSEFMALLKDTPIPNDELFANLGLYLTSKTLSRILFFYSIYQKILHNHGVIMEFGIRWGQTLSLMSALRGIFEPFNRHRKIIGFDTFSGFKGVSDQDGPLSGSQDGSYSVTQDYESHLQKILSLQEELNPMSHLKRFELVKGDATKTVPEYLKRHPETVVSLAIVDFDIYKPTKAALEAIKPHLSKGSILVFDELSDDVFPGETIAVQEVFGLNNLRFKRFPMAARVCYAEIE